MRVPPQERLTRFYDRLAAVYDWTTFFEARAQAAALRALAVQPGERIFVPGVGTGREYARIAAAAGTDGLPLGADISRGMLQRVRKRCAAPCVQADVRRVPLAAASCDGLYCTYLLDLLPPEALTAALREFHRLLRPGGRAVLLTLTEGVSPAGKLAMRLWKAVYRLAPLACGGCRPLRLAEPARRAGFRIRREETIEQLGMPSALLLLEKPR